MTNKEYLAMKAREYRKQNREKYTAYQREYYRQRIKGNPEKWEKRKAYARQYYQNPEVKELYSELRRKKALAAKIEKAITLLTTQGYTIIKEA